MAEAEGIAAEISHYETQGAEMSELDIQSRKEVAINFGVVCMHSHESFFLAGEINCRSHSH